MSLSIEYMFFILADSLMSIFQVFMGSPKVVETKYSLILAASRLWLIRIP